MFIWCDFSAIIGLEKPRIFCGFLGNTHEILKTCFHAISDRRYTTLQHSDNSTHRGECGLRAFCVRVWGDGFDSIYKDFLQYIRGLVLRGLVIISLGRCMMRVGGIVKAYCLISSDPKLQTFSH